MSQLPQYILWLGRLGRDKSFQKVETQLNGDKKSKERIYAILALRFWGHAHVYTPVFSLIFYYLNGESANSTNIPVSLLMLAIGSLSFGTCLSYGGAYADRHGFTKAIRLGIRCMIGLMFFYGAITLFHRALGSVGFQILWIMGQLLVGFPLALIDSADTELTKQTVRNLNETRPRKNERLDGDCLEGICSKLKYSGAALTSFIGCSLFITSVWAGVSTALVGATLFLLTVIGQSIALWQLRRVREPARREDSQKEIAMLRSAAKEIFRDKALLTWVLIIAVTEGWLLFATYYFQFHAMRDLIRYADNSLGLLALIPILYWLLSELASFGGDYFNWWHEKVKAKNEARFKNAETITLRRGSGLDIPSARLQAAGEILGIMVLVFILHLLVAVFFPIEKQAIGQGGYLLSLVPLLFFASYQLLRGFAHPLLKTTLSNIAESKSLPHRATTLSIASSLGRGIHAVCATLFTIGLIVIGKGGNAVEIPASTGALTATIVIVVLVILVLNVLCSIALDRKVKKRKGGPPRPVLGEVLVMFRKRTFRITLIKASFFVCLVLSNLLAPIHSVMGFLKFNAGAIPYAFSFMLVETVAETQGRSASRRLWLAGICSYFVVGFLVIVALALPGTQSPQVLAVFRESLAYLFASLCSFTVAQYFDIWFFLLLKRVTQDKALWLRSNLSTFISQTVDTVIFISVSLLLIATFFDKKESFTLLELGVNVTGQLGIKWIFSLVYTPLLYLAVRWVEGGGPSGPSHGPTGHTGTIPAKQLGLAFTR